MRQEEAASGGRFVSRLAPARKTPNGTDGRVRPAFARTRAIRRANRAGSKRERTRTCDTVCRGKAPSPSGCESRPATVAPAGSNRSGRWRQRHGLKHSDGTGCLGRPGDRAGRNASERRAGLETCNAEADPTVSRGRLPLAGKRATRALAGSAGVVAAARMEEGEGSNTGSPVGGEHTPTGPP